MITEFIGKIDKNSKNPVVEVFNIDREYSYLYLKLNLSEKIGTLFQIYLVDSKNVLRLQHTAGYSKRDILISKDNIKSSIGTYPGKTYKGQWKLIILADSSYLKEIEINYSIEIETTDIKKNIEIDNLGNKLWVNLKRENSLITINNYNWNKKLLTESRWYKGDFHTHSNLSDGKMDTELYMETAKNMNLDFVVTTEHNILPTGWREMNNILVIPGIEVTLKNGHFNILGARKFPISLDGFLNISKDKLEFEEALMKEILYNSKDTKSIYSINHPLLEFWKWNFKNLDLDKIDTIEICNDPTYYLGEESNNKAIELLDIVWNCGYKIYGIGGSDAHILPSETYDNSKERSIIGDPGTFVYCKDLSANNVIYGVKCGHVYVSRGVLLDINIKVNENSKCEKSYLPGDKISLDLYENKINYKIKIDLENLENQYGKINKIEEDLKILFIENGKIVKEEMYKNERMSFVRTWEKDEFKYLRVEIRTTNNKFIAYVNPIYCGENIKTIKTFGKLLEKLEK